MNLKSIRFKIILWYMLILTLTLFVFSTLLYHNLSQRLYFDVDKTLLLKAEGITDSIEAYWEIEKLEAVKDGSKSNIFNKINNANFVKIAQRWVVEKSNDPYFLNIVVQIFDSSGVRIASSQRISDIDIIPQHIATLISGGRLYFGNIIANVPSEKPLN